MKKSILFLLLPIFTMMTSVALAAELPEGGGGGGGGGAAADAFPVEFTNHMRRVLSLAPEVVCENAFLDDRASKLTLNLSGGDSREVAVRMTPGGVKSFWWDDRTLRQSLKMLWESEFSIVVEEGPVVHKATLLPDVSKEVALNIEAGVAAVSKTLVQTVAKAFYQLPDGDLYQSETPGPAEVHYVFNDAYLVSTAGDNGIFEALRRGNRIKVTETLHGDGVLVVFDPESGRLLKITEARGHTLMNSGGKNDTPPEEFTKDLSLTRIATGWRRFVRFPCGDHEVIYVGAREPTWRTLLAGAAGDGAEKK